VAGCAERQDAVAELESTFAVIKSRAESRQSGLEQALVVAEKFWDNMAGALATLKELQENTAGAEPPALEPDTIRDQQDSLEVSQCHCFLATQRVTLPFTKTRVSNFSRRPN